MPDRETFPRAHFARYDESDDRHFYRFPRLTVHLDDAAITALGHLFSEELPPDGVFLDLMSSFRSHFPPELPVNRLVGLGMNDIEMKQNPQLDEFLVHDLNKIPTLPFEDDSFDGVVCSVSIQYLTRPVEVFKEVGRVSKLGAPFIVSFSNRCFPSKAVHIWLAGNDHQHGALVHSYFEQASCFESIQVLNRSPRRWLGDPLFAVVGRRVSGML